MKKFYLFAFSFLFVLSGFAQNHPFKMNREKMRVEQMPSKAKKSQTTKHIQSLPEILKPGGDANVVSIIDIGTSANAFTYWEKLSYLWADPNLNTITNIHRMGGALDQGGFSGDLGYDISKDGGQTWENMIEVYQAGYGLVGSHPNQGIYNPAGNTDPEDAYVSYFSSTGSDYLHGVGNIGDTSIHTATILPPNDRFYQNTALGFDITTDGKVFALGINADWADDGIDYHDSLIITKGTWDESLEDFTYSRESLEALVDSSSGAPFDCRIAFGPDGQTGYIVMIGNNGEAEEVGEFKNLYPIYWKTTDGGETWSEPGFIQLDGPDGFPGIVYDFLTDEQIALMFDNNPPPRDEITYTIAYDCDIAVDAWDNLHIAVVVGPITSDDYNIFRGEGFLGAIDIYSNDGGETWKEEEMGRLRTFTGVVAGALIQDNRIQITTNYSADKIFISWLDTDLEDETENSRPNIFVRGFDPISLCKTASVNGDVITDAPTNVTLNSEGMWEAFFGTAPKYCFEFENGEYTIPYVYVDLDPTNDLAPIQFKYIQDFKLTDLDFCIESVAEQSSPRQTLSVSANVPNPFREQTTVQLELYRSENVSIMVYSLTGQHLFETDFGKLDQGSHGLTLQMQDLSPGVYFYTVTAGQNSVTRKMVVE